MKTLFAHTAMYIALQTVCMAQTEADPVSYAMPIMGTDSSYEFSSGNVYPAITRPWGMNSWTPQTGKMNDGWIYTYKAQKLVGFKQTHQPSPWVMDYGQFAVMPVVGKREFEQNKRASHFSHKAEKALPHYYRVYLADHDTTVELSPTDRAAMFRVTYPKTDQAYFVVDAYARGSYVKIFPKEQKVVGWSTMTGYYHMVPKNYKNYFVMTFDQPFVTADVWSEKKLQEGVHELQANHFGSSRLLAEPRFTAA